MKKFALPFLLASALLFGCAASQSDSSLSSIGSGDPNAFNPWMAKSLPNLRPPSGSGAQMLGALGAKAQTIEGEAKHRPNWREEIYPVVFGERKAPHEIIALLDFSSPESEQDWNTIMTAAKSLNPKNCKIVVFGHSQENYGTDLMGFAIWLSHKRLAYAMPWLKYALNRWNVVKAEQKKSGKEKKFTAEFDATAKPGDFPIPHGFYAKIKPAIPASQELSIARYSYDAGNVNMYQATQVAQYYGITKLPAVLVDGHQLSKVTARNILAALK